MNKMENYYAWHIILFVLGTLAGDLPIPVYIYIPHEARYKGQDAHIKATEQNLNTKWLLQRSEFWPSDIRQL